MKLLYYPNKFLDKQLAEVDIENIDFDPKELKNEMADIMLSTNGIGLSASQVGVDKRVFIMGNNREDLAIVINPQIIQYTEARVLDVEGCLSFPNIYLTVQRPKELLVSYYNEQLEQVTDHVVDHSARVFMHEFDHLNGITFKDRVTKLKYDLAKKRAKKISHV